MDHQRTVSGRPLPEHADRLAIDAGGQRLFLLGAIDRGIGRGVDDHVRLHAIKQGGQRLGHRQIGNFAMAPVDEHAVAAGGKQVAACRQAALVDKRATKLSIGAEQQNSHALKTGKRSGATSCRNGVIRSLSDNNGSLTGQSMPSAASFQRMPASVLASYSAVHW